MFSVSHIVILSAGRGTMATRMKLKLKTVFVLYFMVSLLGLLYALMQLGKWQPRTHLIHLFKKQCTISSGNCDWEHENALKVA